jgi:hypothetical protein
MTRRDDIPPAVSDDGTAAPKPLAPGVLAEPVPLRDALEGIGELWRLPKKRTLPGGMAAVGDERSRNTRPTGMDAIPAPAHATMSRNTRTMAMPAIPAPASTARAAGIPAWVWGAAVVLTIALAWWSLLPAALRRDATPSALLATWRTTHPDYARSAMQITDSTITFMTVDASAADPTRPIEMRHRITGLRTAARGDTTDFTMTYDAEGDPIELQARVIGGRTPSLTFARPEGLTWYPDGPALAGGR